MPAHPKIVINGSELQYSNLKSIPNSHPKALMIFFEINSLNLNQIGRKISHDIRDHQIDERESPKSFAYV